MVQLTWDCFIQNTTNIVGYVNAGYKSDPQKTRSHIIYLFCYNIGIVIYWRSTK